jgi:hypothetical protein
VPRYRDRAAPEGFAMTEDKTEIAPQDARLITLTENYEIAYGTKRFGVGKDRCAEAVRRFGHSGAALEAQLKT